MSNSLKQEEFILVRSRRGHSLAWQGRHGAKSRRQLINYITQSGSKETRCPSWLFFLPTSWALSPIPAVSATTIMAHMSLQNSNLLETARLIFNVFQRSPRGCSSATLPPAYPKQAAFLVLPLQSHSISTPMNGLTVHS